jgi:CheY-like chemotaxis protein
MTPQAPGFERGSKSIVVIDDAEDLAASTTMLLELEGYIACFALTGAAGLNLVFRSGAHAVVLDYMLPDMTGADVAIALRADPATREPAHPHVHQHSRRPRYGRGSPTITHSSPSPSRTLI